MFSNSLFWSLDLLRYLLILHRWFFNLIFLTLRPFLSFWYEIELNLIIVWSEVDMQGEVLIFIILAEHLEAVLDNEIVGVIFGHTELEHVSILLTGHPSLIDHHGHPHWILAFFLLLFLPLLLRDALNVDIMGSRFPLSPNKHLNIEFGHSLLKGNLLQVQPSVMLLQLRELSTQPHPP